MLSEINISYIIIRDEMIVSLIYLRIQISGINKVLGSFPYQA